MEQPDEDDSFTVRSRRSRSMSTVNRLVRDADSRREKLKTLQDQAAAINGCTFQPDIGVNALKLA
eukprot:1275336-Prorocentrum_lima.AAC.1